MTKYPLSRRTFLGGAAASPFVLSGLVDPARAANITVGIVYVGPRQDYGWNQAHAVGAKALKEIPGVKVVEEENVPETTAVAKTMEVDDQHRRRLAAVSDLVRLFRSVHGGCGEEIPEGRIPPSDLAVVGRQASRQFGGYFCYLDQGHYVNGIAAGLSTKIQQDRLHRRQADRRWCCATSTRSCSARARSIPSHRAADRHRRLGAAGARGGSGQRAGRRRLRRHRLPRRQPKVVIETAEKRGVKSCGHNADQAKLAPKGFITGAELNGERSTRALPAMIGKGEKLPNMVIGGYDKDMV